MNASNTHERESLRQYAQAARTTAENLAASADSIEQTAATIGPAELSEGEVEALRSDGADVVAALEATAAQADRFATENRRLASLFWARTPRD